MISPSSRGRRLSSMLRVKECIWLTAFLLFIIGLVTFFVRRSDSNIDMGSKLSSASSSQSTVAERIQELIRTYPVTVFSKSYCPYSRKAKDILSRYPLGKNYHVVELDQLPADTDADAYQAELGKITGARTVPRVFIGGKCIGGGDDTSALEKSGELSRLLKEAKAISDL